jgi:predicted unusual protein kinase regulating ubiquinone biosynthesis (AarF/ABC1/UbiB family)
MGKHQEDPSLGTMLRSYLTSRFTRLPRRCTEILRIFSKYQVYHSITWLSMFHSHRDKKVSEHIGQQQYIYAENMARAFEELGACFIKLGQMLSTRSDLLPRPYIMALSRLQYTITPVPGAQIAAIIEADLGASLTELFSSFDVEPVATASIAQVHKALLHDGSSVVIKVQRPGIQQQVEIDTEVLLEIARFITRHTSFGMHYDLISIVQEIKLSLFQELDFFQEATHTESIGQDIRTFRHLTTPSIYSAYSSRRVLTLSFIPGRHLAQIPNDELNRFAPTAIAKELLFAYFKQVIINGVFHCDPHPGNLLLTDDGRLALLDFGMVGRLDEVQREKLILLLLAFSERQGERVANVYLDMVDVPQDFDRRAFTQNICKLVGHYHDSSKQGMEIGRALLDLVRVANSYHISIPHNFALLGKTLLNLDGTLYRLSPNLDLIQVMHRYLPQIIQQRMISQISLGRSILWLLDAKRLVENTLHTSSTLLERLSAEQSATHRRIEHLDATISRGFRRLSLGVVLSTLIVSLGLVARARQKQNH